MQNLHRIGFLLNRNNPLHVTVLKSLQQAAQQKQLTVIPAEVQKGQDLVGAFSTLKQERVDVLVASGDAILFSNRHEIAELALKLACQPCFRSANTSRPAA